MSERLIYSRNPPEEIEAFVLEQWGRHQAEFALLESLDVQIDYLKKEIKQSALNDIDDPEFVTAYQQHLIKLLGLARTKYRSLQAPGQTGATTGGGGTEAEGQIPLTQTTEVEKIDFNGTVSQFVYFWELLFQIDNGLNLKQYDRRWSLLSKHFTVRGKPVTADTLKSTASNMVNTKSKKPRGHEGFLTLVQLLDKLPEEMEAFLPESQNH